MGNVRALRQPQPGERIGPVVMAREVGMAHLPVAPFSIQLAGKQAVRMAWTFAFERGQCSKVEEQRALECAGGKIGKVDVLRHGASLRRRVIFQRGAVGGCAHAGVVFPGR